MYSIITFVLMTLFSREARLGIKQNVFSLFSMDLVQTVQVMDFKSTF